MKTVSLALLASTLLVPMSAWAKPVAAVSRIEAGNNQELANNFTVMVETAIETTNKFRVMERRQLGNLVQEQAMAGSGMVTTNTPGKTGGFEGVDYLIYGSITSGSVSRKHDMGASFLSMDTQFYELRRHPVLRGVALHERYDFRGGEHAPHP